MNLTTKVLTTNVVSCKETILFKT